MSIAPASIEPSNAAAAETAALLFERHSTRLFAFCLRRLGTREEAEDAVQQTFMKAFAAVRGGFVPAAEKAWLYRIAENVCTDRLRSVTFRRRHESSPEALATVAAPGADGHAEIGAALAGLGEQQRRALVLREWRGLSYREIASELSLSQSAVETLLFRARRSLARQLEAFSFVGSLKSLVAGGGALKVAAATAVTVGVSAIAVSAVIERVRDEPTPPVAPANVERENPAAPDRSPPQSWASNSELQTRPARAGGPSDAATTRKKHESTALSGSSGPDRVASNSELQSPEPPVTSGVPAASTPTVSEVTTPVVEVPIVSDVVPEVPVPAPEDVGETVVETLPELPEQLPDLAELAPVLP